MKRLILLLLIGALLPITGIVTAQDGKRDVITVDNTNRLQQLIRLGRGPANAAEWSVDGEHIFVSSTLGIWQYDAAALDTPLEPQLFAIVGNVTAFAVHPDGDVLAVKQGGNSNLEFYDAATGALISDVAIDQTPQSIAYSADGERIVFNYGTRGIGYLDVSAGASQHISASLESSVPAVITPDGQRMAAASSSGNNVLLWTIGDDEPAVLAGHTDRIQDLTISPDGALLLSASRDDTVIVWDVASGEQINVIEQPEEDSRNSDVYALAFTPDGETLITGHENIVRVWNVAGATVTQEFDIAARASAIRVAPDGGQFFVHTNSNDKAVQLFDLDGGLVATTFYHNASMTSVTFSPDNQTLVISDQDRFIYLWDTVAAGEITSAVKREDSVTTGVDNQIGVAFTSDNAYFATLESFDASLRDPSTGEVVRAFSDMRGIAGALAFSPDDSMIAVISSNGLYIFDVQTARRLALFEDPVGWMNSVAWSPDQTMIATASSDNTVRVYTVNGE